jgi:diguanylate cyclase (GGDEF)-like protein
MNSQVKDFVDKLPEGVKIEPMTQLFSKELFLSLGKFMSEKKIPFALYFIDFDNFKKVNDSLGHQSGDKALMECSAILKDTVQDEGYVCRIGGDEFAILIPELQSRERIWQIAHEYSEHIRKYQFEFLKDSNEMFKVSVTSGISRYPFDAKDFESVLKLADKALYRGKFKGKNCFIIYDKDLHGSIDLERMNLKLSRTGLLTYLFDSFNNLKDTHLAFTTSSKMLGNYYNDSMVVYHSMNGETLFYQDPHDDEIKFVPYIDGEFYLSSNERFKIHYYSTLAKEIGHEALANAMEKMHVRSMLVFKTIDKNNTPAYLLIMARRDKVFSDEEFDMYQTLSLLFATMNHYSYR